MITEDLVLYIQNQIKKNINHDQIMDRLVRAGWHIDDIEAGFAKLIIPEPVKKEEVVVGLKEIAQTPVVIEDRGESVVEIQNLELNAPVIVNVVEKAVEKIDTIKEFNGKEETKVWIPKALEQEQEQEKDNINESLSIQSPEIQAPIQQVILPTVKEEIKEKEIPEKQEQDHEVVPLLVPKPEKPITPMTVKLSSIADSLHKAPVISNFTEEFIKANQKVTPIVVKKNHKWLYVSLGVLFLIAILSFVLYRGYIVLPSFIKKDPKVVLLNTASTFNKYNSYKTNTTIKISSPSFANITSGLISGEEVLSSDTDSILVDIKSNFNKNPVVYTNHDIEITSSFWKNKVVVNSQHHKDASYVTFSDMKELLGNNAPLPSTLFIPEGKFNLLRDIIPTDSNLSFMKNLDLDTLLSDSGVFNNSNNKNPLKDFIQSSDILVENNDSGTDLYNYKLVPSREDTKKILLDITSPATLSLLEEQKKQKEEILGAMTFDEIEFSINKKTGTLVRYRISMSVPLSRIIGLDDKGIADKKVSVSIESTYFDFDIANNVQIVNQGIDVSDFMKNIKDMKLKDNMSFFRVHARNLKNAQGYYGKVSNTNGSCINPTNGSLFSPLGHKKSATTQVSDIAHDMNTLLSDPLNANGLCYSNANSWAFAFPLQSNPTMSFYCIDSKGSEMMIDYPINTTSCK